MNVNTRTKFAVTSALLLFAIVFGAGPTRSQSFDSRSGRTAAIADGPAGLAPNLVRRNGNSAPEKLRSSDVRTPGGMPTSKEHRKLGNQTRRELREQANSGLVTIILGGLDSGDLSDATDLVTVLKDAHSRILPVAGEGAAKEVSDLLFARGIDIAIVQTDVLASLKRNSPFPGIENFLQYITTLYNQEVHILAGREIHSLDDLKSQRVNFGPVDSGTFLTASTIFGAVELGVEITTLPQPLALDKLRRGEIAALVYTAAKPARLFQDIKAEEGLHFLSMPAPGSLGQRYGEGTLTNADYPSLIERPDTISTLSVGTVLAVYNWPSGTKRYRNVARFVETFFGRLAELRMSGHHPKWREVDIHASVEGWTRFAAAARWTKTEAGAPNDRMADPSFSMEGSTNGPVQLSAGSGDLEPLVPETSRPSSSPPSPSRGSSQEPTVEEGDQVSFKPEQLDALFRDFLQYTEGNRGEYNVSSNETLFAEFQTYLKHHMRPANRRQTSAGPEPSPIRLRGNEPAAGP